MYLSSVLNIVFTRNAIFVQTSPRLCLINGWNLIRHDAFFKMFI